MMPKGIRVHVTDLETGEESTAEIMDNYVIVTAGTCYKADEQWSDGGRTVQLTIKGGRNGASKWINRGDPTAEDYVLATANAVGLDPDKAAAYLAAAPAWDKGCADDHCALDADHGGQHECPICHHEWNGASDG